MENVLGKTLIRGYTLSSPHIRVVEKADALFGRLLPNINTIIIILPFNN